MLKFTARTDIGKLRDINEDSFLADGRLFAVADGMGGHNAGEIASAVGLQTFAERFGPPEPGAADDTILEAMRASIEFANEVVHAEAAGKRAYAGMGTTMTAAYLDGPRLFLAQVGDSRAYRFREGELTQLTVDHTLVQEMIARGEIDDELAQIHPLRHVITRALGTFPNVTPDVTRHDFQPGDKLLLCSDGLSSKLAAETIKSILAEAAGLEEAADRLVQGALAAGGEDNITVILISGEEPSGA